MRLFLQVLRHPRAGSAAEGADCLDIPLLNAGDGPNEHPTQALLDTVTIAKELVRAFRVQILLTFRCAGVVWECVDRVCVLLPTDVEFMPST